MAEEQAWKEFETIQIHTGYKPDPITRSTAVPIYATAAYTFNDSAQAARLFGLQELGNIYSRIMNPTVDVFEKRLAALEGGAAAAATASGQAAQFIALTTLARAGDNIVASSHLYGGTYNQMSNTLPRFGITTKFIKGDNLADFAAAIDDKTRALYVESLSNPDYVIPDLEGLAKVAHDHGIPLVVDNTLGAGGYYVRPLDHGADIVVHSATKWIGGHGTTIGGIIIDGGKFDWSKSYDRFPEMVDPSPSYHGFKFFEAFGPLAFIMRVKTEMLRDIGAYLNPFSAHQLLLGVETLGMRADRHAANTEKLAKYLQSSPHVNWVLWPGFESHATYDNAKKYFPRGFGSMVSFGVKGDATTGSRVVDNLKLVSNLANLGDAKTLAIHPWSTTHQQLPEEDRLASGVTEDMIRVSVGIEHIDEIIADFEQSFATVYAA